MITKLPEAASQIRVQAVVKKLNEILKKTKGIEAWVTFGGYSALDAANVSNIATTFIVYEDWSKRGAALSQDKILANLRREVASMEEAVIFVVVPPPSGGWVSPAASR